MGEFLDGVIPLCLGTRAGVHLDNEIIYQELPFCQIAE